MSEKKEYVGLGRHRKIIRIGNRYHYADHSDYVYETSKEELERQAKATARRQAIFAKHFSY